jgi:hypothetical protein
MFKKALFALAIILIVAGVFAYSKYRTQETKQEPVSREMTGLLKEVNDRQVVIEGDLVYEQNAPPLGEMKTLEFTVPSDLKITKAIIHLPTSEELEKTNGSFNGATLKRDFMEGSLEDMKASLGSTRYGINIFAKFEENIYNRQSRVVTELKYEVAQ